MKKHTDVDGGRRAFLKQSASAVALSPIFLNGLPSGHQLPPSQTIHPPVHSSTSFRPVVTPDGATLDYRVLDGVKIFHLIPHEVDHEFAPDIQGKCFGFNGRVHGPTIEVVQGDRVRIYVSNRLESPTSIHWHGLHVPNGMDGVSGLTQRAIQPGETFRYEFTFEQYGTFMYHSHHDEMTQMAMGLMGMIVVHPNVPEDSPPDRDYVYLLSEWALEPGMLRPDPNEMKDFNLLTMNGKAYPGTSPLYATRGERVRIRFGNLSAMDHHPMHLHGHTFHVVATDGGPIPEAGQWPETTVLVPTGSVRTIEFIADNPGDWALHCHMTHHTMNQMGHDIPNMVGVDQGIFDRKLAQILPRFSGTSDQDKTEGGHASMAMDIPRNSAPMFGATGPRGYIPMGGMFTVLKVREPGNETARWHPAPAETVASVALPSDLERDGIIPPP